MFRHVIFLHTNTVVVKIRYQISGLGVIFSSSGSCIQTKNMQLKELLSYVWDSKKKGNQRHLYLDDQLHLLPKIAVPFLFYDFEVIGI